VFQVKPFEDPFIYRAELLAEDFGVIDHVHSAYITQRYIQSYKATAKCPMYNFCRNQQHDGTFIDIDHAFVYPESTGGWARVKGKKNFLKAMGEPISTTEEHNH
jgi:hypothetical protein